MGVGLAETETTKNQLSFMLNCFFVYVDTSCKLTQVDGGYRQLDRQVMVCSQVVNAGCTGLAPGGREEQSLDHMLDYGETTSWSLAMPSDWVAVAEDGTGFYVGANVIFTLQRKSTSDYTWKLHLINNL